MVMLRAGSREFLFCDVRIAGEVPSTPTVEMAAVVLGTSPTDADWRTAQWDDVEGEARFLVEALAVGRYDVFVRVTDVPERPVLFAGRLEIR